MTSESIEELLKRTALNPCIPRHCERNGYCLGCGYDDVKEEIDNFEINDSDVWVSSYPKTGKLHCGLLYYNHIKILYFSFL